MYADYTYYTTTYHGTATETEFNRASLEAGAYIQALTMGRATGTTEVKNAECAVLDVICAESNSSNIASESVGNHSISYAKKTSTEWAKEKHDKAVLFLAPTGLLYRGLK